MGPKRRKFTVTAEKPIAEPTKPEDVAMNPAKLREIAFQLDPTQTLPRILIVSGPPGASKSTAVRTLCRSFGRQIKEFFEPFTNTVDAFGDFLVGCSLGSPHGVVLVDDLPNLTHEQTLENFQISLRYWLDLAVAPQLVVVLTEIENAAYYSDLIVVSRVFGQQIIADPRVRHIKCLAISPRYLTNCLKKHSTNASLIKNLADLGDIRQALNGLESGGAHSLRDAKLSIFHRLGQIVWASKNIEPESLLDFDEYDQQFETHLFENYMHGNGSGLGIGELCRCTNYLSLSDAYSMSLASYAIHQLLAQHASQRTGKFTQLKLALADRQTQLARLEEHKSLDDETAFVREWGPVSIKDIQLQRSLGLRNQKPPMDIYLSSSDDEF